MQRVKSFASTLRTALLKAMSAGKASIKFLERSRRTSGLWLRLGALTMVALLQRMMSAIPSVEITEPRHLQQKGVVAVELSWVNRGKFGVKLKEGSFRTGKWCSESIEKYPILNIHMPP